MNGSMPGMALWLVLLIAPLILAIISLVQARSASDHTEMGKNYRPMLPREVVTPRPGMLD